MQLVIQGKTDLKLIAINGLIYALTNIIFRINISS